MKSIALLTALLAFTAAASAAVTETFKQSYPLAADGTVHLDNVNGDIDIVAWDKPEVAVEAEKRAKNDEQLKRIEIIVDAQPAKLSIKTKYAKHTGWSLFGNNEGSVRYKLMVPAGARLDKIDSVNSDIGVTNVHASVNLNTVNGSITATGLTNDARLESVNGSLRAQFATIERAHDIHLESVNGRLEVTLPKGANATLKTETVNGSSSVDQPIKLSHSGKHDMAGEIGSGAGPTISLETVNGGISVREK